MGKNNYNQDSLLDSFIPSNNKKNEDTEEKSASIENSFDTNSDSLKRENSNTRLKSNRSNKYIPKTYYFTEEQVSYIRISAAQKGVAVSEFMRGILNDHMKSNK